MNKLTVEYFDSIKGSRNTSNAPKVIKKYMENYYKERGKDVEFRIRISKMYHCKLTVWIVVSLPVYMQRN